MYRLILDDDREVGGAGGWQMDVRGQEQGSHRCELDVIYVSQALPHRTRAQSGDKAVKVAYVTRSWSLDFQFSD